MPSQKKVTFGEYLTITEFPIALGDNPSCTGCPITIGWEPIGRYTRNLESYELAKARWYHYRRNLVIPVQIRSQMLLDAGYTHRQIIRRALDVVEIQNRREDSLKPHQSEKIDKLSKKIKDSLRLRPSKTFLVARSA